LAADLAAQDISGKRIVCVVSEIARDELANALTAAGAEVVVIHAYTNTPTTTINPDLRRSISAGEMEAVTFASPSSVVSFLELVGIDLPALSGAAMIAIGPTTAAAMRDSGLPVHGTAQESTVQGLINELARYFGGEHTS
jgi:uroporphyrinogen-III synthase